MTRTIGAAIGALIIMLFMSHIATRMGNPISAPSPALSASVFSQP